MVAFQVVLYTIICVKSITISINSFIGENKYNITLHIHEQPLLLLRELYSESSN